MPPAARVTDPTAHPLPPALGPGPGSPDVLIGGLPAWRAVPAAVAKALKAAKKKSDAAIEKAEKAAAAATGTLGADEANKTVETTKKTAAAVMAAAIIKASGGADIHTCTTLVPPAPHGPGIVIKGSSTVLINNLPAARMGDTILEAVGPPNQIAMGCPTVIIGDRAAAATLKQAAVTRASFCEICS